MQWTCADILQYWGSDRLGMHVARRPVARTLMRLPPRPALPPAAGQMHLKGWGTPAAVKQAAQQWEAASKLGHLLAAYNLAMLHLGGQTGGGAGACAAAVGLLKGVAERGFPAQQVGRRWPQPRGLQAPVRLLGGNKRSQPSVLLVLNSCGPGALSWGLHQLLSAHSFLPPPPPHPHPQEANDDFQAGDYEWALLNYLKAAEMGVEAGQSNAAWMLTEGYGYEGGEPGGRGIVAEGPGQAVDGGISASGGCERAGRLAVRDSRRLQYVTSSGSASSGSACTRRWLRRQSTRAPHAPHAPSPQAPRRGGSRCCCTSAARRRATTARCCASGTPTGMARGWRATGGAPRR